MEIKIIFDFYEDNNINSLFCEDIGWWFDHTVHQPAESTKIAETNRETAEIKKIEIIMKIGLFVMC